MIREANVIVKGLFGLALLLVIGLSQPANAQQVGGASMLLDLARADYLHRDINVIAQELDLDDSQRMILDSLFEDYRTSFEEGWMGVQESMAAAVEEHRDQLQDLDPQKARDLVFKPLEDWQDQKQQKKESFESDIQVILNEEQMERWPALERRLTREKTLHLGRLSGENVDLIAIVRQQQLSRQQERAIESILQEYSIELDRTIRERNDLLFNQQADMLRTIRETGSRPEDVARNKQREVQARVAVREVNDRYIDQIATALPQEPGEHFRRSALEAAYQRAYRPITAQRVFDRALQLDTLEDEVRHSIRDLRSILSTELEHINRRIYEATRRYEPEAMVHEAQMRQARMHGERAQSRLEDPTHDLVRNREEQAEYYVLLLRDMLTEEEFASIPGTQRWRARDARADGRPTRLEEVEERRRLRDARRDQVREARERDDSRDRERPSRERRDGGRGGR